jgi:outer membrane immunogenic protein
MKKLIVAGITAAALCSAPAYAASPVFDWSGFYIGAEAGGGWHGMAGVEFIANDAHLSGALAGVQVGTNWQNGNWITGVRADINISHIHGNVDWGGDIYSANVRWFGTAELQSGFLIDPTNKIYGTGGFAFGNVQGKLESGGEVFKASHTMSGWTLGAGIEHAFSPYWSAFVEYKYLNLGTSTFVLDDPERVHVRFSVVKAGVNWKYGTQ